MSSAQKLRACKTPRRERALKLLADAPLSPNRLVGTAEGSAAINVCHTMYISYAKMPGFPERALISGRTYVKLGDLLEWYSARNEKRAA